MPTLILTPRFTEDAQALWRAAAAQPGWRVERLTNWRVPDDLRSALDPVLYLESLFGPSLALQFGLQLLEPEVDWLPRLPEVFRKREVAVISLTEARKLTQPHFIKPPNDKSFPAGVYIGSGLPEGYNEHSPVLVAEVVCWSVEFRCFILDRRIRTISVYLRNGELQRASGFLSSALETKEAQDFLELLLADDRVNLPRATGVDVGVIAERGWAVVEQNAAWASGIYGCDPVSVLEVLRHAAVKIENLPEPRL